MADHPIIFSALMVRALLDGRKTMTRRLAQSSKSNIDAATGLATGGVIKASPWTKVKVGDRLWVRETWQGGNSHDGPQLSYRATPDYFAIDAWDGPDEGAGPSFNYHRCPGTDFSRWLSDILANDGPWRSPIHMPRWASRLTLIVTAAKIERLQDISLQDVRAEGVEVREFALFGSDGPARQRIGAAHFGNLWSDLHGRESWHANPLVVALTFRVVSANIDNEQRRAA